MKRKVSHTSSGIKVPLLLVGLLLFFSMGSSIALAQTPDSTAVELEEFSSLPKDPRRATILSAILPGAGQVYNEKAWKVPIIYGGFLTDIYFINFNNKRYKIFKDALLQFDNDEQNAFPNLNRDALSRNVNYWRKNRDLCYLLLVGIYALNIVDANVDAHLSGFNVSDDLSLNVEPHFESFSAKNNSMGFSIKLNF